MDVLADLARVAERLRSHPDVLSGPSVRAMMAAADLYESLGAVPGDRPPGHPVRLLRACLPAVPHRLRVLPGTDAETLVREAVFAVALPRSAEVGEGIAPAAREAGHRSPDPEDRPVFRLDDREQRTGPGQPTALPAGGWELAALLDQVLRPARRRGLAEGTSAAGLPPLVGDRISAVPMRPGDRRRELSVRSTLRAGLRRGLDLTTTQSVPPEVLRRRPPHPRVTCDLVLSLDVSASMAGAGIAPLARALITDATAAGHRVALQVFSAGVSELCGLSRRPEQLLASAGSYSPENPTNLEFAIQAARELLRRTGARAHAGTILLVTDAEPTICGTPTRLARGFGPAPARAAALAAAAQCRAEDITLCLLVPPPGTVARVDVEFAARLAAAGGGIARTYPAA